MLGRFATVTFGWALGASAFLLPPGSVLAAEDNSAVAPFDLTSTSNIVKLLPCPSCSNSLSHDVFSSSGVADPNDRSLLMNLTIGGLGRELYLNEQPLYPFDMHMTLKNFESEWSVDSIPADTNDFDMQDENLDRKPMTITGAATAVGPVQAFEPDGEELVSIAWQLLSLNEESVDTYALYIQLIKSANGELSLLSVDLAPGNVMDVIASSTPGNSLAGGPPPPPSKPDCGPYVPAVLCKLGHDLGFTPKHGRPGCGGDKHDKSGKQPHGPPHPGDHPPPPHHGPPHHGMDDHTPPPPPHHHEWGHGPHGHHRHHHHRHGMLHHIFATLVPIVAGISAGVIVSVLGFMTGRFIGWLWFTVFLGRRGRYVRVGQSADVDHVAEKSVVAHEDVEALPLYEEAPAYEEAEKTEV